MNINSNYGQSRVVIGGHRLPNNTQPNDGLEESWAEVNNPGGYDTSNDQPTAQAKNAKSRIAGIATGFACAAHKAGAGAAALQHGAGMYFYANAVSEAGWLGAYRPVQYFLAQGASKGAEALVCGTAIGSLASVGGAILTAVTVAQVGAAIHNTFIAKNEQDKISLSPWEMTKQAYGAITGLVA